MKVGDLVEHVMRREVGIITGNAHGNAYGQRKKNGGVMNLRCWHENR